MKNLTKIGLAFLLLVSTTVYGQDIETQVNVNNNGNDNKAEGDFKKGVIGFRYMPTVSSLKGQSHDGFVEGDFTIGHGFGALLGFNFTEHFGMQVEVIYNRLSQKFIDHELNRIVNIDYINIPLMFSFNSNTTESVNFNFVVGPQIGLNIGSKITSTGTANGNASYHAILAVKDNDFGLAYGASLDISLNEAKTTRLDFGFRGVYGLIDISDNSGTLETNQFYVLRKGNIQTYSAFVGLKFYF